MPLNSNKVRVEELEISSIGLGTYLGPCDAASDDRLLSVLQRGHEIGVNFVDTAPNYRGGRSERVIGKFLRDLPRAEANRWVVATKAGFLPRNLERTPSIPDEVYFTKAYFEPEVVRREWLCGDWQCFHPDYLEWQVQKSLTALGRSWIDIFYFHNPETALLTATSAEFEAMMRLAFRWAGKMVRAGYFRYLGISTWGGLLGLSEVASLDLYKLVEWAQEEGVGSAFRFIEAPISAAMPEALLKKTQRRADGEAVSLIRCAAALGHHVLASAPLFNGRLINVAVPPELQRAVGLKKPAQAYLEFARSAPGVAAVLVGTLSVPHLEEVAQLLKRPLVRNEVYRFLKGA